MAHQSLYRAYRPQTFDEVVGQTHIVKTLQNAIARNAISHAYLFTGPRGTGKTTTARLLAKALLCKDAPTANPDGTCDGCEAIANGMHPDVYELDAASRTGVENVREEIISRVGFSPTSGMYKVYIIDEVHMLSTAAFNALLKTLEEPPSHVVFVLCTTDPQKVPATIISRCQRFDFHSLDVDELSSRLRDICEAESIAYDSTALDLIATNASGGMRDAISSLEQVSVFGNGSVSMDSVSEVLGGSDTLQLANAVEHILNQDIAGAFMWVDDLAENGLDAVQVTRDLTSYVRDIYVARISESPRGLTFVHPSEFDALLALAKRFDSVDRIASLLVCLGDLMGELRYCANQRLALEIAMTRMAHPAASLSLESLSARISALENGEMSPAPRPAASAPATDSAREQRPSTSNAKAVEEHPQAAQPMPQAQTQVQPQGIANASKPEPARQPAQDEDAFAPNEVPMEQTLEFLGNQLVLEKLWKKVQDSLASKYQMVAISLEEYRLRGDVSSKTIFVELPKDGAFKQKTLSTGDVYQDALSLIADVFGNPLGLRYVLAKSDATASAAAAKPEPAAAIRPEPAPAPAVEPVSAPMAAPAPAPAPAPEPQPAPTPAPALDSTPAPRQSAYATEDAELASLFEGIFGDGIVIRDEEEQQQ